MGGSALVFKRLFGLALAAQAVSALRVAGISTAVWEYW
jgi:hypothetical protein